MHRRRDFLKIGLATGGFSLLGGQSAAAQNHEEWLQYLCPPNTFPPDLSVPSPPVTPFKMPLFIPQAKKPVSQLSPLPDPLSHQLYDRYSPKKFYLTYEQEFLWCFHPDPPYNQGTWCWGFDGSSPGPTYIAKYGEPILVRRVNNLPPIGHPDRHVHFGLPSTTTHLHNAHTASESDGDPNDWIDPGEFWDHHYGNFPSGNDPLQKLTTLWYHDHRMDFTAANVYAGLWGAYLLFDEYDTGNENDPDPQAWRLPSGKYDIPLLLQDLQFDQQGQMVFNLFNTDGVLGDRFTVNRIIQPHLKVERRKYRFRILNGGPSRFYQVFLYDGKAMDKCRPFVVITGDGNFLEEPIEADSIYLSVAQRVDVIIDFSQYEVDDHVYLLNLLEQTNGKGPSGRMLDPNPKDALMRFDVVEAQAPDPSRIPDYFRKLQSVDLADVRRDRNWTFDYDGGLWTINGQIMDPQRIEAVIERGSAEIWTFRNSGNDWAHPIHNHFTEFIILEVNGKAVYPKQIQTGGHTLRRSFVEDIESQRDHVDVFMGGPRRDVVSLLPGDEIKVYIRFSDFLGKYVMHCHNVVHEDHAMMIRWDVVPAGEGVPNPERASTYYKENTKQFPDPRPPAQPHLEARPGTSTSQEGQT
ncbi:multicopper oxidase family protein [Leptothoe spongobia]|uniref:Multicopper oxidase CueO n=1 Tax=Leptothoe spongobia TAU-MAC 1115 TaxID=1967444 RepID=A0A947DH23_9CYAN|nr:multicopper oxidase domain-containing protein [Leptothoe spongobia]MBT9316922.1 multicopper oxidase domain-containing protein [Leptothoe spongobia TAU-MAC 1115]